MYKGLSSPSCNLCARICTACSAQGTPECNYRIAQGNAGDISSLLGPRAQRHSQTRSMNPCYGYGVKLLGTLLATKYACRVYCGRRALSVAPLLAVSSTATI